MIVLAVTVSGREAVMHHLRYCFYSPLGMGPCWYMTRFPWDTCSWVLKRTLLVASCQQSLLCKGKWLLQSVRWLPACLTFYFLLFGKHSLYELTRVWKLDHRQRSAVGTQPVLVSALLLSMIKFWHFLCDSKFAKQSTRSRCFVSSCQMFYDWQTTLLLWRLDLQTSLPVHLASEKETCQRGFA